MTDLTLPVTLNCRGRLVVLDRPLVMGILNLTPDSFYAHSRVDGVAAALAQAKQMAAEGADLLDVGAMSSRPGAEVISAEEEWRRLEQVLPALIDALPQMLFSVDTVHGATVRRAAAAGVHLINDISAGKLDADMYPAVAETGLPYILMHMQGRPETMKQQTGYDNLLTDIWDFLAAETGRLRELGVRDLIIDPGFGFGKTIAQNFELLREFGAFRTLGLPLLAGISRKSMIWKTLDTDPAGALNGTTALHMVALQQGANILRVHDVKAAVETITLFRRLYAAE